MVDVVALAIAAALPRADGAVLAGVWGDGRHVVRRVDRRDVPGTNRSVVRREVRVAKPLGARVRPAERQDHPLRLHALDVGQEVGVEGDLKDGACLGFSRQLRVDDLVRPVGQVTRCVDPAEEVRLPEPGLTEQRALVDHVWARAHGVSGLGRELAPVVGCLSAGIVLELDDREALGLQSLEVGLLVLEAAREESLERGVVVLGCLGLEAEGREVVEQGEVVAG